MRHWVFDLDGTLVNSFPSYFRLLEEILANYGVQVSQSELVHSRHVSLPQFMLLHLNEIQALEASDEVIRISMDRLHEVQPFEGIIELLAHLKGQECHMSVWTARERVTAEAVLNFTGLSRYFDRLISRTCVEQSKPHPEGMLRALSESGTLAIESVMIGDHAMDMQGARAAGVKAIGACWLDGHSSDISHLADHHFTSVADFAVWAKAHYIT